MSRDTQPKPPVERPERDQYPAAETVAHLSEATYHKRVDTFAKRILPRLTDETGTLYSVNYNKVLGHLKVIERMSFDNPFSVLAHSKYELNAFDWERVNSKHPVHGLTEQARRLVAGDVQQRLLELAVAENETHRSSRSRSNGGHR
jgi:hypothetical protein